MADKGRWLVQPPQVCQVHFTLGLLPDIVERLGLLAWGRPRDWTLASPRESLRPGLRHAGGELAFLRPGHRESCRRGSRQGDGLRAEGVKMVRQGCGIR